ncbi:uncharacterized protein LOC122030397 [Zingiber officinale]|uniref:uncharacterized protein LOC122030397 n=1 Tax=Zingiber officinale TaxID=94328 RepID=UPI001C4D64CA|nr:uncharacterized protein LOC122030397 [Zingiber officinale]
MISIAPNSGEIVAGIHAAIPDRFTPWAIVWVGPGGRRPPVVGRSVGGGARGGARVAGARRHSGFCSAMGICSSCEATAVAAGGGDAAATTTAKLVLQERFSPGDGGHVLQKQPSCFVCSADDMEFDDYVSAVDGEDELQLGQLYFLLPVSMLRRRLHADDIAALAVKASAALMSSGGAAGGCHCRALVFPEAGARLAVSTGAPELPRRRRRRSGGRRGGGRGRDFKSTLRGIPE